jgi:hypothetical protein
VSKYNKSEGKLILGDRNKNSLGHSIIPCTIRVEILDSATIFLLVESLRGNEVAEKRNDGRKQCKQQMFNYVFLSVHYC